jgi:hypothetical protein
VSHTSPIPGTRDGALTKLFSERPESVSQSLRQSFSRETGGKGRTKVLLGQSLAQKSNAKGVCQFQPRVSNPGITRVPPDELCKSSPTPTELSISGNQHSPEPSNPGLEFANSFGVQCRRQRSFRLLCKAIPSSQQLSFWATLRNAPAGGAFALCGVQVIADKAPPARCTPWSRPIEQLALNFAR